MYCDITAPEPVFISQYIKATESNWDTNMNGCKMKQRLQDETSLQGEEKWCG